MMQVHPAAAEGYARAADAYERGRLDYPPALQDWLRTEIGLAPGRTVAEVGAGTGKFTRLLAATGASVVAVEPVAAMRDALAARLPGVRACDGTAEALPLADGACDAVLCAQAFHWFDTAAALEEMRRVLRPRGMLGLVWNVRDESVPWVASLSDIFTPYEGDVPRYRTGRWHRLFPAEGFGPLEAVDFPWTHEGSPEAVIVDRTLSVSFIAALPEAERARVAAEVRALVAATPELAGRARVAFPYRTAAFACRRL